jgi:hypothetical protein
MTRAATGLEVRATKTSLTKRYEHVQKNRNSDFRCNCSQHRLLSVGCDWACSQGPTLAAFERNELSDNEFENVVSKLLNISIWHQRGEAPEYDLTSAEIRRALTIGPPSVRRNVAWLLWRAMAEGDGEEEDLQQEQHEEQDQKSEPVVVDRATRWREVLGPLFTNIWPLDARLRSEDTTKNLVLMAEECEEAFPEVVEAIIDLIVPYELYELSISLMLEDKHRELVGQYPRAFVKLVNALVDPALFPVPRDLAPVLQGCVAADPAVANDAAYIRLYGLRRQRGA